MLNLTLILLSLNVTLTNTSSICISYTHRAGSLLATDLSLWLIRPLIARGLCYNNTSLLEVNAPYVVARNITITILTNAKNVTKTNLDIKKLRWYVYMLQYTSYRKLVSQMWKCFTSNNITSLVCGIVIEGIYHLFTYNVLTTRYIDPCVLGALDYLNTSIPKNLALWSVSKLIEFRRSSNNISISLLREMISDAFAYFLYYNKPLLNLTRYLYTSLGGRCNAIEAYSLITSVMAYRDKWWMYYPLMVLSLYSLSKKG